MIFYSENIDYVHLKDVAKFNPKSNKDELKSEQNVNFVGMNEIGAGTGSIDTRMMKPYAEVAKGYTQFRENDILFAKITPCMENGKIAIVPRLTTGIGFGSTEFIVIRCSSLLLPKFLYYFLSSERYRSEARKEMTGNVGHMRVPLSFIENTEIPNLPIYRQKLVVEYIESHFIKISEGLDNLQNAEKQLELYRQSVLKDAFEGKLTADWRKANPDLVEPADKLLARIEAERKAAHQAELDAWKDAVNQWEANGKDGKKPSKPKKPDLTPVIFEVGNSAIMPENWIKVQISIVLSSQSGSTPKGISNVANGAVNYIKVDDMNAVDNEIKIQNSKMMLNAKSIKDFSMNLLPEGTVIFPKRGGAIKTDKKRALSKPSCVDTKIMGLVNSSQSILNDFIYTFMKSFTLFQISDGSNVPQINNGSLKAVAFPICSPEEQQEVCRIIGEKFERIDNLKTSISFSFSHSNALRQSILKQAFSGYDLLEDAS